MKTKYAVSFLQKAIFDDINWSPKVARAWQTLKTYVLAQQTTNIRSMPCSPVSVGKRSK